jgi:hypothetical protein
LKKSAGFQPLFVSFTSFVVYEAFLFFQTFSVSPNVTAPFYLLSNEIFKRGQLHCNHMNAGSKLNLLIGVPEEKYRDAIKAIYATIEEDKENHI